MKKYLLTIYQPDGDPPPPEVLEPAMAELDRVNSALRESGAWVFGAGLYPPSSATVVRGNGADALVTDGPYLEGKEHVGGFTVIEAEDLDVALDWARRVASAVAPLAIEVRPMVL